jgi:hypothetical protein
MDLEPTDKKLRHENIVAKFTNSVFIKLFANTDTIWNKQLHLTQYAERHWQREKNSEVKRTTHCQCWISAFATLNKLSLIDAREKGRRGNRLGRKGEEETNMQSTNHTNPNWKGEKGEEAIGKLRYTHNVPRSL